VVVQVDYYRGLYLVILEGPGAGETQLITSYTAASVVHVEPGFVTTPTTSSRYIITNQAAGGFVGGSTSTTVFTLAINAGYIADSTYFSGNGMRVGAPFNLTLSAWLGFFSLLIFFRLAARIHLLLEDRWVVGGGRLTRAFADYVCGGPAGGPDEVHHGLRTGLPRGDGELRADGRAEHVGPVRHLLRRGLPLAGGLVRDQAAGLECGRGRAGPPPRAGDGASGEGRSARAVAAARSLADWTWVSKGLGWLRTSSFTSLMTISGCHLLRSSPLRLSLSLLAATSSCAVARGVLDICPVLSRHLSLSLSLILSFTPLVLGLCLCNDLSELSNPPAPPLPTPSHSSCGWGVSLLPPLCC